MFEEKTHQNNKFMSKKYRSIQRQALISHKKHQQIQEIQQEHVE